MSDVEHTVRPEPPADERAALLAALAEERGGLDAWTAAALHAARERAPEPARAVSGAPAPAFNDHVCSLR